MAKTSKGFNDSLSLYSLWGFVALALLKFLSIDLIPYQNSILMILAGIGLALEGQILTIRQWGRNGIQKVEAPLVLSIVVGLFAFVMGILLLPFIGLAGPKIDMVIGIVSVVSIGIISLERWVF